VPGLSAPGNIIRRAGHGSGCSRIRWVNATQFRVSSTHSYAYLLAVTYQRIKRTDPSGTVLLGGLAFIDQPGHPADDYLTASSIDVTVMHFYSSPDQAAPQLRQLRGVLGAGRCPERPVWITEAGQPAALNGSPDAQARWLGQLLPRLVAIGAAKVFWFELYENPGRGAASACSTPSSARAALGQARDFLRTARRLAWTAC
jgi:hypothetical protein